MRLLVTGASGAFGASMAELLLDEGHEVISIEHDSHPIDTATLLNIRKKITWAKGSILDERFCKRVVADYGIEGIFHFAALPIVQVGTRTAMPVFQTNIMGTINLLEAVRENTLSGKDIVFIQVATDKVYGDAGSKSYTEDMPLNALAVYDSSKACSDLIARTYATSGFVKKLAVVRPCNIIARGDLNLGRVLPRLIIPCLRGEDPVLYKTDYRREFIDAEDACLAIYKIFENIDCANVHGEAFNIGSGEQKNMNEVVIEVLKLFPSRSIRYIEKPKESRIEIPFQKLSTDKIESIIGWRPQYTFSESVKDLIFWWQYNWNRLPDYVKNFKVAGWD